MFSFTQLCSQKETLKSRSNFNVYSTSFQPGVVNHWYFKLNIFNLTVV